MQMLNRFLTYDHRPLRCRRAAARVEAVSSPAAQAAPKEVDFENFTKNIVATQESILQMAKQMAEQVDGSGKKFIRDKWERDPENPNADLVTYLDEDMLIGRATGLGGTFIFSKND
eukprot:gene11601-34305_t